MMRNTVCFFFSLPPYPSSGGIERASCVLAEELSKLNYKLYYIYIYSADKAKDSMPSFFEKIIQINPDFVLSLSDIEKFISENKIEIVIFQGGPIKYLRFLSTIKEKLRIKIIVAFHMSQILSSKSIR